jgi:hypothetical protein
MGPITYSLCQKPVIGLVMFATTLCAFPPLISDLPLSLAESGTVATKAFTVPVDKSYFFDVNFEFPSADAFLHDSTVGTRFDANCRLPYHDIPIQKRDGLGRPIAFHVLIRRRSDRAVVIDRTFESLCLYARGGPKWTVKTRTIGRVELTRGQYIAEIENLEAQPGLAGVKASVSLVAGHGK